MKLRSIIAAFLLTLTISASAQITLDTIIDSTNMAFWFKPVQLGDNESKYYLADTANNTFDLYNMDFTPFLINIQVPEPFISNGPIPSIFQAIYITRSLFDCDSTTIEYAYEAATHSERTFYIMRTDGSQLFRLDSANGPYCFGDCLGAQDWVKPIVSTSAGTKMFLQRYSGELNIYSLCGNLPPLSSPAISTISPSFVKVFPNPSSGSTTFEIHPPNNSDEYTLVILSETGKEVSRKNVDSVSQLNNIEITNLKSGCYFYSLCSKKKSYQSGKFIVNN